MFRLIKMLCAFDDSVLWLLCFHRSLSWKWGKGQERAGERQPCLLVSNCSGCFWSPCWTIHPPAAQTIGIHGYPAFEWFTSSLMLWRSINDYSRLWGFATQFTFALFSCFQGWLFLPALSAVWHGMSWSSLGWGAQLFYHALLCDELSHAVAAPCWLQYRELHMCVHIEAKRSAETRAAFPGSLGHASGKESRYLAPAWPPSSQLLHQAPQYHCIIFNTIPQYCNGNIMVLRNGIEGWYYNMIIYVYIIYIIYTFNII